MIQPNPAYSKPWQLSGRVPKRCNLRRGGFGTRKRWAGLNPYTFTVTASNGVGTGPASGASNSVTPFANSVPRAVNDRYDITAGQTLAVAAPGVLGNDSDSDGDPLSAILLSGPAQVASFTLQGDGGFSYSHLGTTSGNDSFTYKVSDGRGGEATATVSLILHSAHESEAQLTVTPSSYLFGAEALNDCENSRPVAFTVSNSGSSARSLGQLSLAGADRDQFAWEGDGCSGQTLRAQGKCTVVVKFCPDSSGSKGANLHIPLADAETPVLSAYLHNYESTNEEARRRLPAVLFSLNVPEVMTAGQSYTLTWSQLGYDDSYISNIVFFNCAGVLAGTCGDSYGTNFQLSGYLPPESVEPGDWTYSGITSRKFNYRYTFVAPPVPQDTDIVIRFYTKSQADGESGNGGLSTLIPGNLAERYYNQAGRRILKQIKLVGGGN